MINMLDKMLKAPVPGAHLTQDPKKKAWHKPPTYTSYDEAMEYMFDVEMQKESFLPGIITLAGLNLPMTTIVTSMLMGRTGAGLFSPDMALKMAGPTYKLVTAMLDKFEVDYITGFETPEELKSKVSGKSVPTPKGKPLTPAQQAEMDRMTEEATADIPEGGLMGASTGEGMMDIPADTADMPSLMQPPEEDTEEEMQA
jgi:hypothetical protein